MYSFLKKTNNNLLLKDLKALIPQEITYHFTQHRKFLPVKQHTKTNPVVSVFIEAEGQASVRASVKHVPTLLRGYNLKSIIY